MKYIIPGLTQPSGLNVDHISHDKAVVANILTTRLFMVKYQSACLIEL